MTNVPFIVFPALSIVDLVEYYVFYLLYIMSEANSKPPASSMTAKKQKRKATLKYGNSLKFHWPCDASGEVYLTLLDKFLAFMAPQITPQMANQSLTPVETILSTQLLKSSSPLWSRTDVGLRYSMFFTGCLVEFWMNLYSYAVDAEDGVPISNPPFALPSYEFLEALKLTVRHFSGVKAIASAVEFRVDPAYKTLANETFNLVRLSSYRFLRVALSVWPVDGSLALLIDVWVTLVAPWFHLTETEVPESLVLDDSDSDFGAAWRPYVVSSFYLYQSIYAQLFVMSRDAFEGFLASGECADLNEVVGRLAALIAALLDAMNPLLSVGSVLKRLEADLFKSVGMMQMTLSEVTEIKNQLRILEPESFRPVGLFDAAQKASLKRMLSAMDALLLGVFGKLHAANLERQSFLDSDEDLRRVQDSRQELYAFVRDSPDVPQNVKSLASWSLELHEQVAAVFGVSAVVEEKPLPKASSFEPRRRSGPNPMTPRDQIRFKLSARSRNSVEKHPIRSYELAFLVPLLEIAAAFLTRQLHLLLFNPIESKWNVKLPPSFWAWKVNLRFFAAYPNLIFCLLVLIAVRVVIKLTF